MASKSRAARIDVAKDLPARARRLDADALSRVFGGCKGEWVTCSQNAECCSNKCRKAWWVPPGYWTYECLPTWATG